MTWKFLYVDGLKARLALPHMSFIEECRWRLNWYNQRPSGLHVISHRATVPMVNMAKHFKFSIICKWIFPFLLSKLLFYTWLLRPCRKWGSNEEQQCNKTYIPRGSENHWETTRHSNGFTSMHTNRQNAGGKLSLLHYSWATIYLGLNYP